MSTGSYICFDGDSGLNCNRFLRESTLICVYHGSLGVNLLAFILCVMFWRSISNYFVLGTLGFLILKDSLIDSSDGVFGNRSYFGLVIRSN